MLARKMSSGVEQHGLLQSEYLEDLASQETGDQGQRVNRQSVRHQPGIFWNDQIFSMPWHYVQQTDITVIFFKKEPALYLPLYWCKVVFKISIGLNISLLRILQWSSKYWALVSRRLMQLASLLSLVSVSANTPQSFKNYPQLRLDRSQ